MDTCDDWSCQRIARKLNADKVPAPGDSWNRNDTGANRKNSAKGWRTSAIAGDAKRGVGILNNELYIGRMVRNRSAWTLNTETGKRECQLQDKSLWNITEHPGLRILDDRLWKAARAVHAKPDWRKEAVKRGIAKSNTAKGSAYWLGSILECGVCGSNYIGYGPKDYCCPSYTSKRCTNDLRFRRDDVHKAMFGLLQEHLLSDDSIERGQLVVRAHIADLQRAEADAAKKDANGAALRKLDDEVAKAKRMGLRPAALEAS